MENTDNFIKKLTSNVKDKNQALQHFNELVLNKVNDNEIDKEIKKTSDN